MCMTFYTFAFNFFESMISRRIFNSINRRLAGLTVMLFVLSSFSNFCAQETSANVPDSITDGKTKTEWVALKNNLLYDAIATPNLQMEFRLTRQWSLEIGAGFNPFPLDDTKFPKWRHIEAHIAPRYWFCHVFNRDFLSFNVAYVHYNVAGGMYPIGWMYRQVLDNRYEGDALMAGLSYGWHFAISPHFSIELEGGVDAGYSWYKEYECKHCGEKKDQGGRWMVLPKLGVNLVVPLGGDESSLARRCDCEKVEEKPEEPAEPLMPAERLEPVWEQPAPVVAWVPPMEVKADNMRQLRSRLLRDDDEYETYDAGMALSADPRNVFLFFDVNVTKMDRSFIQNDLLMDSIMHILGDAWNDPDIRITHIRIVGFASFDGRLSYNERLAASRAETIKEYMQSIYPLPDSIFDVCNGGESWAELKYGLQNVEFEGRDEVFEIIDTEPDADTREKKIKALHKGATYRYMRDELKHILRNLGCITIYCETIY